MKRRLDDGELISQVARSLLMSMHSAFARKEEEHGWVKELSRSERSCGLVDGNSIECRVCVGWIKAGIDPNKAPLH